MTFPYPSCSIDATRPAPGPIAIGPAETADLPQVAAVFADCFGDTVTHLFSGVIPTGAVEDLFRACLDSEPEGFHIARSGAGVAGYVFAPASTARLWKVALVRGHVLRWIGRWIRGEYGFGLKPIRVLLADKIGFVSSAFAGGPYIDARILSIAVSPRYRGMGLGSRLLRAGLDYLDRCGVIRVRLEVRPGNAPAVAMYRSAGFQEAGSTRDSQGKWTIMVRESRVSESRGPRGMKDGTGRD